MHWMMWRFNVYHRPCVAVASSLRQRFVATKNVIVAGVLLHQTRSAKDQCIGKFGAKIGGQSCPDSLNSRARQMLPATT